MRRRPSKVLAMVLAAAMLTSAVTACGENGRVETTEATTEATEAVTEATTEAVTEASETEAATEEATTEAAADDEMVIPDGFHLVWNDEFDGDSLNLNDWNVEKHEPGWVNSELQRYTGIEEGNIQVKDGNMVIKPHVEEITDGEASEPEEEKITHVSFEFTVGDDKKTSESIALQVNFGKIDDSDAGNAKAKVKLSNISLVDTADDSELVRNGSFSNGDDWYCGITSPAEGSYKYEDGSVLLDIEKSGDANWNYQLQQSGLKLEQGHT